MERLANTMEQAIYKLKNNVKPVFDPNKWELTGEVIDVVDCYDRTEVVNSLCGTFTGSGIVSAGELVDVEDVEFIID